MKGVCGGCVSAAVLWKLPQMIDLPSLGGKVCHPFSHETWQEQVFCQVRPPKMGQASFLGEKPSFPSREAMLLARPPEKKPKEQKSPLH